MRKGKSKGERTAAKKRILDHYTICPDKKQPEYGDPHGNQFLQLDPELKPSPLGDRFPPRRGKMSHSDKRGNRWRVAPDEGYLSVSCCLPAPSSVTCGDSFPRPGEAIIRKVDFHERSVKEILPGRQKETPSVIAARCHPVPFWHFRATSPGRGSLSPGGRLWREGEVFHYAKGSLFEGAGTA